MDDAEPLTRIHALTDHERGVEPEHDGPPAESLGELEVALDESWDVLRPRRERRPAGEDPDAAVLRPASAFVGYKQ